MTFVSGVFNVYPMLISVLFHKNIMFLNNIVDMTSESLNNRLMVKISISA